MCFFFFFFFLGGGGLKTISNTFNKNVLGRFEFDIIWCSDAYIFLSVYLFCDRVWSNLPLRKCVIKSGNFKTWNFNNNFLCRQNACDGWAYLNIYLRG